MIDDITMVDDSLIILQRQREKLLADYLPNRESPDGPYFGKTGDVFVEEDETVRSLYSKKYRLEWLLSHWDLVKERVDKKTVDKSDKREFIVFFAKNFDFMNDEFKKYPEWTEYFFDQLVKHHELIKETIKVNEDFEENFACIVSLKKQMNRYFKIKVEEYGGKKHGRKSKNN